MKKKIFLLSLLFIAISVAQTTPPTMYFSGPMNNFKVDAGAGYIAMGKMWAANLPEAAVGGKIIISKGGAPLYTYKWTTGQSDGVDTLMEIGEASDSNTGEHVGMPTLTEPGDYTMDFFVDNTKFYSFPFKISKLGEYIFVDGAWSDWGYITYPDADPLRQLQWKVWLRDYSADPEKKLAKVFVDIVRDKDKKLICSANPTITWTIPKQWQRFELDMMNPAGHPSGEDYTKAKYLLEQDGGYTLTMKVSGQVYGVWKFNVKGGKLQPEGRTIRAGTDPLSYVHGGVDAFWYERESK